MAIDKMSREIDGLGEQNWVGELGTTIGVFRAYVIFGKSRQTGRVIYRSLVEERGYSFPFRVSGKCYYDNEKEAKDEALENLKNIEETKRNYLKNLKVQYSEY